MILEKDFAGLQTVGARESQQDFYAFAQLGDESAIDGLLLVLADGMGGHRGGEQASLIAVNTFIDVFQSAAPPVWHRLHSGMEAANNAISDETKRNPEECDGMGTTLLAAVMTEAGLQWLSVGDSSLSLYRSGKCTRLNEDHSMRSEKPRSDPKRSALLSAIVGGEIAMVDSPEASFALQEEDIIIAASDGLDTLTAEEILSVIDANRNRDAREIAVALLRAVSTLNLPKQDNTTIAVIKIDDWYRNLGRPPLHADSLPSDSPESIHDSPTRRIKQRISRETAISIEQAASE